MRRVSLAAQSIFGFKSELKVADKAPAVIKNSTLSVPPPPPFSDSDFAPPPPPFSPSAPEISPNKTIPTAIIPKYEIKPSVPVEKPSMKRPADKSETVTTIATDPVLLKQFIVILYSRYNKSKVSVVDLIIKQYLGREKTLVQSLTEKYNVSPGELENILNQICSPHVQDFGPPPAQEFSPPPIQVVSPKSMPRTMSVPEVPQFDQTSTSRDRYNSFDHLTPSTMPRTMSVTGAPQFDQANTSRHNSFDLLTPPPPPFSIERETLQSIQMKFTVPPPPKTLTGPSFSFTQLPKQESLPLPLLPQAPLVNELTFPEPLIDSFMKPLPVPDSLFEPSREPTLKSNVRLPPSRPRRPSVSARKPILDLEPSISQAVVDSTAPAFLADVAEALAYDSFLDNDSLVPAANVPKVSDSAMSQKPMEGFLGKQRRRLSSNMSDIDVGACKNFLDVAEVPLVSSSEIAAADVVKEEEGKKLVIDTLVPSPISYTPRKSPNNKMKKSGSRSVVFKEEEDVTLRRLCISSPRYASKSFTYQETSNELSNHIKLISEQVTEVRREREDILNLLDELKTNPELVKDIAGRISLILCSSEEKKKSLDNQNNKSLIRSPSSDNLKLKSSENRIARMNQTISNNFNVVYDPRSCTIDEFMSKSQRRIDQSTVAHLQRMSKPQQVVESPPKKRSRSLTPTSATRQRSNSASGLKVNDTSPIKQTSPVKYCREAGNDQIKNVDLNHRFERIRDRIKYKVETLSSVTDHSEAHLTNTAKNVQDKIHTAKTLARCTSSDWQVRNPSPNHCRVGNKVNKDDWIKCYDPVTDRFYKYSASTRQSVWC